MQLLLAEFCGRWGCSWQEGLLTLFFMALFKCGPVVGLLVIFAPILLIIFLIFYPIIFIYDKITYFMLPEELRKKKELESNKTARRIGFAIKGGELVYKWRQNKIKVPINNQQEISQTNQTYSSLRPRFLGRVIELIKKK